LARRVFFSFNYERDIFRVNTVRQSWLTQDREAAGFWDASLWEKAKLQSEAAIKRMIDEGLKNTSVTAVLIGKETDGRPYVDYEIEQSLAVGNGILGVYINGIKDARTQTMDSKGSNPLDRLTFSAKDSRHYPFSSYFVTYDWVKDDGYANFGAWVEAAAKQRGR